MSQASIDLSAPGTAASTLAQDAERLQFVQPVPRHLVHRAAIAEVLLTDSVRLDEQRFLVAAQWPRDHALHNPDAVGRVDPLLFAETIRQMFVYLPHTYLGIPLTHRFIGDRLSFDVEETAVLQIGPTPLNVVLEAEWTWEGNRPPNRYGMRLDVVLTIDGVTCGRGRISGIAVDDRRYSLLRRRPAQTPELAAESGRLTSRHIPVAPAEVGRLRAKDCVLERGVRGGTWWLRVDTEHAIYFDHPSDHVPLMVALEGFRQLGYLLVNGDRPGSPLSLASCQVECLAFGELDEAAQLVVEEADQPLGDDSLRRLRISVQQGDRVFARATTLWTTPAATRSAAAA